MSKVTVLQWRTRYSELGMTGLDDLARSGRPRRIDHLKIVAATLKPPPKKYGVTHWSSRLMGQHLGIVNKTVATAGASTGCSLAAGDVQVLHRPRAGGQGHRRRRGDRRCANPTKSERASSTMTGSAPANGCRVHSKGSDFVLSASRLRAAIPITAL